MTKSLTIAVLALTLSPVHAQSQDMIITTTGGSQASFSTGSIGKIDFVTDRTTALRIVQEGTQTETALTAIRRITFETAATHVETGQARAETPRTFVLRQNRPNPFNPATIVEFELAAPGRVEIGIFNMKGQLVRRLVSGEFAAGVHRSMWLGLTDQHQPVTSLCSPLHRRGF